MKKYKIAVLTDLNNKATKTIKNAVSLAKMINADLEVFSVRKPTDVIQKENQLSAIRTINNQSTKTAKKLKELVKPIAETYNIKINSSYAFGNVKNEIKNFIDNTQPDIIVLGKRKSSPFKFLGDGITQYVFNTFKGAIMVASDKNSLEPNTEISLGMLNNLGEPINLEFADDLMANTQKPLKSFKIVKNSDIIEEVVQPANQKIVEYVFEHGDNSINSLSNYINKNNVDLLCFNRKKKHTENQTNFMKSDVKNLINNLNVNFLVTPE